MTTTLHLITALSRADQALQDTRKNQDWLGVQEAALEIAKLSQQLQCEEKVAQVHVDHKSASRWFARMRKAAV